MNKAMKRTSNNPYNSLLFKKRMERKAERKREIEMLMRDPFGESWLDEVAPRKPKTYEEIKAAELEKWKKSFNFN